MTRIKKYDNDRRNDDEFHIAVVVVADIPQRSRKFCQTYRGILEFGIRSRGIRNTEDIVDLIHRLGGGRIQHLHEYRAPTIGRQENLGAS